MIDPEARKRLADAMDERRIELGLTWREVAQRGRISPETVRAARNGTSNIPPLTAKALEEGLAWRRGTIEALLSDEPVAAPAAATAPNPASESERPADYPADFPDHPALWDLWLDARLELRDRYVAILAIKGQWDLAERERADYSDGRVIKFK